MFNKENLKLSIYDKIKPDPTFDDINNVVEIFKIFSGDIIIAIGGGSVIDAAKGADLVIHEVAAVSEQMKKRIPFFSKFEVNHTSPENVGKVFAAVKPKLGVFTHLVTYGVSPDGIIKRASKTYSGKMVVGRDLMRISVGKLVRVLDK